MNPKVQQHLPGPYQEDGEQWGDSWGYKVSGGLDRPSPHPTPSWQLNRQTLKAQRLLQPEPRALTLLSQSQPSTLGRSARKTCSVQRPWGGGPVAPPTPAGPLIKNCGRTQVLWSQAGTGVPGPSSPSGWEEADSGGHGVEPVVYRSVASVRASVRMYACVSLWKGEGGLVKMQNTILTEHTQH